MNGRGERIRTFDLLVPNEARYQAALHPAQLQDEIIADFRDGFYTFMRLSILRL